MAEQKQVPMWQDYLGQMPVNNIQAPYAAGTKTMDHLNMDSANARHSQSIASQERMQALSLAAQQRMHGDEMGLKREDLELRRWAIQMEHNYKMMTYEAAQAALQKSSNTGGAFGDIFGGLTPGQWGNEISIRDVLQGTGVSERRKNPQPTPGGWGV